MTVAGRFRGALLRGVAVVSLATASFLAPAAASPALAADDALSLVSTASYSLVPDKGLVHVVVDVGATNNKPNKVEQTPNGTLTTRYFFDEAAIAIQPEATAIRASAGKRELATRTTPDDGFTILRITFRGDLQYKQSTAFRVEYDLPGGAPRSDSNIRVGSAFATFYAWSFGDSGDVRIVIPGGYDVETSGSTIAKSADGGITTLSAAGIDDPTAWFAVVVADRHDALTQDRLDLADGEHLVVRAWPEDTEWRSRVGGLLRRGLPVLVEKIGLDWPVEGDIEVAEVHTPLLEGYAGIFYTNEDRIEISEDLDELTIIHEASHAWFNSDLFVGRWINEGFADEYASRVLDEVSGNAPDYDPVTPGSDGHVKLNAWEFPGRIADEETQASEEFGYNASWKLVRGLVRDIGEDSMRKVFAAADASQTAYVGATEAEEVTIANDWRRFLDLLEEVGGSTSAEDAFRNWVTTPEQDALLDVRATARTAYEALLDAGDGWKPGYVIRDPMGRWEFVRATREMAEASEILATRDRIAARAAELEVAPPASLRAAYEAAKSDLGKVRDLASAQLATATALDAAAERVAAEHDAITSIGLIGEDPLASLTAATAAFSNGDAAAADAGAAAVESLMAGAADAGTTRVVVGGLAGVVLAAGAGGAVVIRRRRMSSASYQGPAAPFFGPFFGPTVTSEPTAAPEPTAVLEPTAAPEPATTTPADPPAPTNPPEPYATLGDPPPIEAAGDGPAAPGRAEGDDT